MGAPGARLQVIVQGVGAIHAERTEWNTLETGVIDPFGNMIRFCEPLTPDAEAPSS